MRIPFGDSQLEVDFTWTSYGSPDSYFEPGDPPEVQIVSIEWVVKGPIQWLTIAIPECVWDVRVPSHQYCSSPTMSLNEYCETWILATENPADWADEPDYDYYYDDYSDDMQDSYWNES